MPGQELMAVNGTDVSCMSYEEVIKVLKDAPPIKLALRTPAGSQLNGERQGQGQEERLVAAKQSSPQPPQQALNVAAY